MIRGKVLLRHDHQISLSALDPVRTCSGNQYLHLDLRRLPLDFRKCVAHERRRHVVRHHQPERPVRRYRCEDRVAMDDCVGLQEQLPYGLGEFLGKRRQNHLASYRDQEIVFEVLA